jgi:mono/diheme cytochrome c family protein
MREIMIERYEKKTGTRTVARMRPRMVASLILLGAVAAGIGGSARDSAAQAAAGKSTFDGVYSDAQSARGEKTSVASCAVCHGDKLAGTDMGPGVAGPAFRENWSGRTVSELFDKVKTTMPANDPGTLSAAATADVVAYILKVNDYPAGSAELPSEMAALSQIKLRHQK